MRGQVKAQQNNVAYKKLRQLLSLVVCICSFEGFSQISVFIYKNLSCFQFLVLFLSTLLFLFILWKILRLWTATWYSMLQRSSYKVYSLLQELNPCFSPNGHTNVLKSVLFAPKIIVGCTFLIFCSQAVSSFNILYYLRCPAIDILL